MAKPPRKGDSDTTHETGLPDGAVPRDPDDQATGTLADLGVVAELRAIFQSGEQKLLPLYALPDQVVVGRGTACEWQLDDVSLSRKHARFHWNGRTGGLLVEDLGSANGTRVNGRPARNEVAVKPGDSVQLGTVVVTLEPKGAPAPAPRKPLPDDQPTRLVSSPALPPLADPPSDPGLTPIPAAPTVIRPDVPPEPGRAPIPAAPTVIRKQPPPGVRATHALVFRPPRDAARPEEPTRSWDPRAVLVRAPAQAFDGELLDRLRDAWRYNRRPFVLAGAAVWLGILLLVWTLAASPPVEEPDPFAEATSPPTAPPAEKSPEMAVANPPEKSLGKPAVEPMTPLPVESGAPAGRDEQLAQAIAAYDQGHLPEALVGFKKLAADPKDAPSRFMVELIESRLLQKAKP
jgi:pSer/pThr/pTyr-binding forkhead associated (FHA) protein